MQLQGLSRQVLTDRLKNYERAVARRTVFMVTGFFAMFLVPDLQIRKIATSVVVACALTISVLFVQIQKVQDAIARIRAD